MIERHLRKLQRHPTLSKLIELRRLRARLAEACKIRRGAHVGNDHNTLDAGYLHQQLRDMGQGVNALARVEIAVRGKQYFRRYLSEAIQHTVYAEVGRTG